MRRKWGEDGILEKGVTGMEETGRKSGGREKWVENVGGGREGRKERQCRREAVGCGGSWLSDLGRWE